MYSFIKTYWKYILAIGYAVAIPLYFYSSFQSSSLALTEANVSSNIQFQALIKANQEQKQYYDKLFEDYQVKFDEINTKYYNQQLIIDQIAKKQKNELIKKWNTDPNSINPEIEKRFPIKNVNLK